MEKTFETFATFAELQSHVRAELPLYYFAPLDPRPVLVSATIRRDGAIRVSPIYSDADPFTAGPGHLNRFRRTPSGRTDPDRVRRIAELRAGAKPRATDGSPSYVPVQLDSCEACETETNDLDVDGLCPSCAALNRDAIGDGVIGAVGTVALDAATRATFPAVAIARLRADATRIARGPEIGDEFETDGYTEIAALPFVGQFTADELGEAVLLSNDSTHFLVAVRPYAGEAAELYATFRYAGAFAASDDDAASRARTARAYRAALAKLVAIATEN